MARHRLSDDQWACIVDVFPPPAKTGRPPKDRRLVMNAILWILRTGAPWRDLPEEFGPWQSIWCLFDAWNENGVLDEILRRLQAMRDETGDIDETLWCVDGTNVRAARCAGGGGKRGSRKNLVTTH